MRRAGTLMSLALVPVIVGVLLSADLRGGPVCPSSVPPGPIEVTFPYSPEKEEFLEPLFKRFNSEGAVACGRPIRVKAEVVSSGAAESKIAKRELKPVAWSPASSLWGRLLNFDSDEQWVADDNPSIVRTPLVIAMWEPLARALGWPDRQVGFDELLRLARSKEGWAAFGRPEFGRFKLGHTNPDFSTSGLSAVAAEYVAATNQQGDLSEEDVRAPEAREAVRGLEESVVHYGDTTLFFADQLEEFGPDYAHAVAMEEVTLLDFNKERKGIRLAAVYPDEGTFFSDNPFIILDAPWVRPEQKKAAEVFQGWLAQQVTPRVAAANGFRPGDSGEEVLPPIRPANGVLPDEPQEQIELPQPEVLNAVRRTWRQDSKPANVVALVDTSGSMGGAKLQQAKDGLSALVGELLPEDRIGLVGFGSEATELAPVLPLSENRAALQSAIQELKVGGGTRLHDAIDFALGSLAASRSPDRISAIVVLSDGEDTTSRIDLSELTSDLERQAEGGTSGARVYSIPLGQDAKTESLEAISTSSRGSIFEAEEGEPFDIETIYRTISSYF